MGGCGGGYLHITVADFQNDGAVMVDAQDAPATVGGGGSGGSMQIHAYRLEGTGEQRCSGLSTPLVTKQMSVKLLNIRKNTTK